MINDDPASALTEVWHLEGASDSESREIHSQTGWHLANITPSGALDDNFPLFVLICSAPELAKSLRAVLDLVDRFLDTEDWEDDYDRDILNNGWALLERINQ